MCNENNTEIQNFLESKKHKRNMNAFFREDVGIWKVPHPEVDNALERLRSKIFIKNPKIYWVSRLYKRRKRLAKWKK